MCIDLKGYQHMKQRGQNLDNRRKKEKTVSKMSQK